MRHSNKKWLTYVLVIRIIALLCRIYAESEVWDMAGPDVLLKHVKDLEEHILNSVQKD